jgi:hypothetical protein
VIRRLSVAWPDPGPFAARAGEPIRWLVVSDDVEPALEHEVNRVGLGRLDAVVGCGDLEPDYLGFLCDAFAVPMAYVRGNHDRGGRWQESSQELAPHPLESGALHELDGLLVVALEWPGLRHGDRARHDGTAWTDALRVTRGRTWRQFRGRASGPVVVVSHAPPHGVGDTAADAYHLGFAGYRWLLDRLAPPLWLHGHVPPASVGSWRVQHGPTTVVNATGAVLVEFRPEGRP